MIGLFLLFIIPFYIQAYTLYGFGLEGTSAFAIWRGVPDLAWFKTTLTFFVSPDAEHLTWQLIPIAVVLGIGLLALCRFGFHKPLVVIAVLAYLFTMYHFNKQYASRMLFFFSIFWAAAGIHFIKDKVRTRWWAYLILGPLMLCSITDHLVSTTKLFARQEPNIGAYREAAASLAPVVKQIIGPLDRVFASEKTYRMYIMPYFSAFGLMGYKSGEYFQIASVVAEEMRRDYDELLATTQIELVEFFCQKYNIRAAVAGDLDEMYSPVFQTIDRNWPLVYKDDHFRVYRRP
jgi:hypothetical protein